MPKENRSKRHENIKNMNLNELRDEAYSIAKANGWHEQEHSDEHWLMLIITEIAEAVQADRKGKHADVAKFKEWQGNSLPLSEETRIRRFKEDFEAYIKNSVEDELADACIRLLDYWGTINFVIDDSCLEDEVIEEFSRIFKRKTFTESVFNIVTSITRFEIQITFLKIFGLAKHIGIDLEWHIEQKMRYNEPRPYKHGDKNY